MYNIRKINEDLIYVGGSDSKIKNFESMFVLNHGMSYNSYLLLDEKTVLFDTIDNSLTHLFINNIKHSLNGRELDYLVVHHMEPDHCANIPTLTAMYPNLKIIGNKKTFQFIKQFYPNLKNDNFIEIKDKDQMSFGKNTFEFIFAPMLHWPEVMTSYNINKKYIFTADIFGSFGMLSGNIFSSEVNFEKNWIDEIRRYYINIVGKFGMQANSYFKKLEDKEINMILPLHGLILNKKEDIDLIISKYKIWANYQSEKNGVVIFSASMYGNSELANQILASKLAEKGVKNIEFYDVSQTDISKLIERAHLNSHIVFTALAYYSSLFPPMKSFLDKLIFSNCQNKSFAIITNETWGSSALKEIQEKMLSSKNTNLIEPCVKVLSSPTEENIKDLELLANNIVNSLYK